MRGDSDIDDPVLVPIERDALLRRLADGEPHAWAELAEEATGRRDAAAIARTRSALTTLADCGLALVLDAAGVRCAPFVPLDHEAIRGFLSSGWRLRVVQETGSTNTDLLAEVRRRTDPDQPAILVTESQTGGRGRLGRRWVSAPGASLAVSFALRVDRPLARLDGVTLVCGLAVRRALAAFGADARLKWPNDLLIDGRKVAGILVEAHVVPRGTVLVVGVGVNVASRGTPSAASTDPASGPVPLEIGSLATSGQRPVDRNRLVATLASTIRADLATFDGAGFASFVAAWNTADAFLDRPVTLQAAGPGRVGVARGVDATGALRLEVDGGGEQRFIAGEVSLRPATEPVRDGAATGVAA